MALALLSLVAGLAILIKGADWLVEGASSIARRFGISELAIGLTVVAFGTSLPELTVNIFSSFSGANDLAIGNVIGSNISNILLILGISACITPMRVQQSTVWKEIPFALLASLLIFIMANDSIVNGYPLSELSRSDGLELMAFFAIFLWYTVGMQRMDAEDGEHQEGRSFPVAAGLMVIGIACLVGGGKIAVDGAVQLAQLLGMSQALIGLTVVAVGTSLPELATSVVAALKKKSDIAVGNIVGSNIFNVFWILGLSSTIRPLTFSPSMNVDLLVAIGATVILFFAVHTGFPQRRLVFWKQKEGHIVERIDGLLMVACYIAYTVYVVWRG